jgi:hypothetical protein
MTETGWWLVGIPLALLLYTYVGYPGVLLLVGAFRRPSPAADWTEWPAVSVSLPAYNEADAIGDTIRAWLAVDYPKDKLQIVVTSDASTDETDTIVRSFAEAGVELLRLERRSGKTAAENEAAGRLTGEIIVNTDASVRVRPDSVKSLVRTFADPTVGVASGRDISVGSEETSANAGERSRDAAWIDCRSQRLLLRYSTRPAPHPRSPAAEPRFRQRTDRARKRLPCGLGPRRRMPRTASRFAPGGVSTESPHDGPRPGYAVV